LSIPFGFKQQDVSVNVSLCLASLLLLGMGIAYTGGTRPHFNNQIVKLSTELSSRPNYEIQKNFSKWTQK